LVSTPNREAHFNEEDAGDLAYELLGEAVLTMKQREQRLPALRYWMA
jgi:hypothetical protein